jgi:hypothetical protein
MQGQHLYHREKLTWNQQVVRYERRGLRQRSRFRMLNWGLVNTWSRKARITDSPPSSGGHSIDRRVVEIYVLIFQWY